MIRSGPPQRVSTLELFFDLVFVFTITQLTSTLAGNVTLAAAGRLLLVFGVLWWMYGGYAWLTNARTPSRAPERLLLGHPGSALSAGPALALAGGVALFLAGDVAFRHVLGIGTPWYRALGAALALAAWPLSVAVDAAAGIALLTAVVAGTLAVERLAEHATVEA